MTLQLRFSLHANIVHTELYFYPFTKSVVTPHREAMLHGL